ncbi:MAG: tetratricopeptide repeat protein [Bacilli bacterium]|jgi:tetratricopeptide (TPR) repeat protein|nr:tetratricopeptide repeat protein [Bacilli bacterium]
MFEQLFATMNDVLNEISIRYHSASITEKKQLDEQLTVLKTMSDRCMEQWLAFEENLALFFATNYTKKTPVQESKDKTADILDGPMNKQGFEKAQGFYKLYMFDQAVSELEKLVQQQPDFLLARMYLAMGYLRLGEDGDAYRHFQLLLPLTDDNKLKAISYNAMGCIQVKKNNMQRAMEYFKMAYSNDPSCIIEPTNQMGQP